MPDELDPRSGDESPTSAVGAEPTSDSSEMSDAAPGTAPEPGSPTAGTTDTSSDSEEVPADPALESTPTSPGPESSPATVADPAVTAPVVRGLSYAVDIVFCIDVTGSMTPIIDSVKANALRFYEDVQTNLTAKGKNVDTLRVRVIAFRDFTSEAAEPLQESSFYTLPDERTAFDGFVSGLVADGGGDAAESGLEALSLAINSPWTTVGDRRRQVIVVWTDAPAHPLNLADLPPDLATSVPGNFSDLTDLWEDPQGPVGSSSKRLILFAPDGPGWGEISANWENVVHHPSEAGSGLSEVDYGTIVDSIGNSV